MSTHTGAESEITSTVATGSLSANGGAITGALTISGALAPSGGMTGTITSTGGDYIIATAGNGLNIKGGTNSKFGTIVATGVTEAIIATTAVTANSQIFLTPQVFGGSMGVHYISSLNAGASFGIKSTNTADTSTLAWLIIEKG